MEADVVFPSVRPDTPGSVGLLGRIAGRKLRGICHNDIPGRDESLSKLGDAPVRRGIAAQLQWVHDDGVAGPAEILLADAQPRISPDDVLVKYTYFGDTNLDGRVSIADYLAIDRGFARGSTGWANGDFDYSGAIDGTDFFLIDQAFLGQGSALNGTSAGAAPSAAAAVPEPSILCLLIGTLLALRRRLVSRS